MNFTMAIPFDSNSSFTTPNTTGAIVSSMKNASCERGDTFILIVGEILPTIVGLLGILGNLLSLIILHQDKYPGPTFYSLRFLAASDTCLLFTSFFSQIFPMFCFTRGSTENYCYYAEGIRLYIWPVTCITTLTTIWLTLLISAERYVAICHPLKARKMCTIQKVRIACILIVVISVLYNIPKWFEFETYEAIRCGGAALMFKDKQQLRGSKMYQYLYNIVLHCVLQFAIPMSTLAFFNIRMVQEMQKAKKQWELLNRKRRRELRAAVIPLVIVIIFFVTSTQSLSVFVLDAVISNLGMQWLQQYTGIVNLLVMLNSALNFVIFYLFGSRFRLLMFRTIKCAAKRSSLKLKRKGATVQHMTNNHSTNHAFMEPLNPDVGRESTDYTCLNTPDNDFMKSFLSVPQTHNERRSSCQWSEYSDNSDDSTPRYAITK